MSTFSDSFSRPDTQPQYPFPKATARHRLGGWVLDYAFYLLTFGIGWAIWSIVTWNDGQTPGKQILKMRVFNKATGTPAKWRHMALRQFLFPFSLFCAYLVFVMIRVALSAAIGDSAVIVSILLTLIGLSIPGLFIVDSFWVLKDGELNRLVDKLVKTDVLNEAK
jgi:uncharacterized RDD family membrane protein YckC